MIGPFLGSLLVERITNPLFSLVRNINPRSWLVIILVSLIRSWLVIILVSLILIGHYIKILDSDWIIFRWGRRGGGGRRRGGRGGVNWSINQSIQKIIFIGIIYYSHLLTANYLKCLITPIGNLPFLVAEYFIFNILKLKYF